MNFLRRCKAWDGADSDKQLGVSGSSAAVCFSAAVQQSSPRLLRSRMGGPGPELRRAETRYAAFSCVTSIKGPVAATGLL